MAEDLLFKAIQELTDDEDDLWTLAAITKVKVIKFRDLYVELRDYAIPDYKLRQSINSLLERGLIVRVHRGKYTANMRAVLGKAMELLEEREEEAAPFG